MFGFYLEGEVVCQMAAFVVPSQHEESCTIPHLERVQVKNALNKRGLEGNYCIIPIIVTSIEKYPLST